MTSEEYFNWLSKFETKKTTDDCFTPPQVYDVVLDYVDKHVMGLDGKKVVRPFYPNGDYQVDADNYDENTIVIDNPPFSILTKICDFYLAKGIKFFLFAPAMTVFSGMRKNNYTAIIAPASITYANGAVVNTAFVTNMLGDVRAMTAPKLYQALDEIEKAKVVNFPKYQYPPNVLMVNDLNKLCKAGIEFEIKFGDSQFISKLDSQKAHKKALFGNGFLISHDKSQELTNKLSQYQQMQSQTQAIYWELSERERAIVESLGVSND